MLVRVQKLNENAIMPKFEYEGDSGFSLYSCQDMVIKAGKRAPIPTGLAFEFEEGYAFQIKCRSGITLVGVPTKEGFLAKVTIFEGTIDNNYRGNVSIIVENNEKYDITIPAGTKLAQGIIIKTYKAHFVQVSTLSETDRQNKGFGSTGSK